jgi:CRISPR-associated protein (TIGR03986 family)
MSRFVNPYNFITLGEKCNKSEKRELGRLTGVLTCTLVTKTPLFIPNTTNEHAFPDKDRIIADAYNKCNNKSKAKPDDPKSYDFYSYDDITGEDRDKTYSSPVIPGSSIRGAIRNAYEAVTNSCLSTIDEELPIHKRSSFPYMKSGVIRDGVLYKAEKALFRPKHAEGFSRPHNNFPEQAFDRDSLLPWSKVKVSLSDKKYITSRGHNTNLRAIISIGLPTDTIEGYYLRSERFGTSNRKHFDAVMIPDWNASVKELDKDDTKRLSILLSLYSDTDSMHKPYKDFINANPMPVYYEKVGETLYISPACISNEVLARTIGGILEKQGNYAPCKNKTSLCEACHLFGMVKKDVAIASRLSFRDAEPVENAPNAEEWYDKPQTLAILGEPHITATEFYMNDPGKEWDLFNYDYANKNRSRTAIPDNQVRLRGRKFYWHSKRTQQANIEKDNPKQLWTVRPVKAGKTFVFDIAFERLTSTELAKLIWTLEIGGHDTHAHKLGHGKPIGYGSVQIRVDKEKSVIWEMDSDLIIIGKPLKDSFSESAGIDTDNIWVDEFIKITNFDNCPDNVQYPQAMSITAKETETNVFSWFGINKEIAEEHSATKPRIANVLPKISDNDISLPNYTKDSRERPPKYAADNEKNKIKGNRI